MYGGKMRRAHLLVIILIMLCCPTHSRAQLSSGIISSSRAMDWTQAGIPGGLPSTSWTQCGSTIAAYSGSAATINSALSACGANQYVLLGSGTFTLNSVIDFGQKNNVVLRGSGANSTFVTWAAGAPSGTSSCNTGYGKPLVGICNSSITCLSGCVPSTIYQWTSGYAQGATQVTLSGTAGISKLGSGNLTLLQLTQNDDGYTGYPATGTSADNGNYFVCADLYVSGHGCSNNGPDKSPVNPINNRQQYETAVPTAVSGNTVTLQLPLKHPNWRSGQSPIA